MVVLHTGTGLCHQLLVQHRKLDIEHVSEKSRYGEEAVPSDGGKRAILPFKVIII